MRPMSKKTHIGIKDISKALGLSMMSVSRALRGVEGVSAETRRQILSAAKVMGYRPNRNARSLVTARSTLIGISLPTLFSDVFPEILDGMRAAFDHAGFDTVIDTTDYNRFREADWIERMLDWNAAGLVLSGVDHADDVRTRLRGLKIPTLEIWDATEDPIDICVGVDHFAAGADLGQYLARLGYRRPAFVGVPEGKDTRADRRLKGLERAFSRSGVDSIRTIRIDRRAGFQAGSLATEILLAADAPAPDVICYLNDHMAFGGIATCIKRELSVPNDIGIAGFNDLEINAVLPLALTTVVTPRQQMGETGARNLLARINGAVLERSTVFPTHIKEGRTTRGQVG